MLEQPAEQAKSTFAASNLTVPSDTVGFKCQKQIYMKSLLQKISGRCVQESMALVTRGQFSTGWSLSLCARVETSLTTMELEENPFMDECFQMRTSRWSTLDQVFCLWPMLDPTPMDLSSSSALLKQNGWMASMLSLAAWRRDWTWSRKWSLSVHGSGDPPRRSLSQTVESSSRLHVDVVTVISCCNFNREREWKSLSSVMEQSTTSISCQKVEANTPVCLL